jgi:PAS domain S-box-containing protein
VAAVTANEAVDIKDAFQPVLEEICSYTGWEIGHAYVISKDDPNLLEPTSVWRLKDHKHFKEFCDVSKEIKFARGIGLPGRVLASRKPHWIVDVTKDKNFLRAKIAKAVNIKSGIAVPVMVGAKVVAVMTFFTTKALEPDQQFLDIMADVGTQLGRAVERKQAEAQIRKLSRVVEQSPNIVMITNTKGNIEYVNPKFTQTTGYSFEEALNQNPRILKSYRTPQEVYEQLWKTITSGKEWRGEFCNKKKSGELFWESAYILPIKNDEGDIIHFVAIKEDITERKKMEEELIKAKKLESVGILAGGIAHDFNNNLQAILSSINLAETCTDSKDKIYKILEEVKKIVFRSKNLTRQLLTFSKGGEPIKNTIFVSKLIRDSANLALSGSNVRCEFDIQSNLWPVDADKGQMNQVISNLVINANQATPEGGIIRLRAENTNEIPKDSLPIKGRYVKITIEDNGIGISQENLQKIFDPYFTTKQKGSGLGLAITHSIIKKHGGYITVESEIGIGTTFHIYLPASIQKEIQKKSDPSALPRIDTKPHEVNDEEEKPSKSKGKILLMDDEDVIRISVTQHLRNQKYEVKTAKDGTEAIKLYKKAFESGKPFDAVIIDLTIVGGMGGEGTIKELLGIDPNVKAIVSSGYSNNPVMANFRKYGFRDVLAKPYEIQELDETLQKVIMRKEE